MSEHTAILTIGGASEGTKFDPMIFGGFLEHFDSQVYGGVFEPGSPQAVEQAFNGGSTVLAPHSLTIVGVP